MHRTRVGVLFGGPALRRELSLRSAAAVIRALSRLGIPVIGVDVGTNLEGAVDAVAIDAAFLCLAPEQGGDGRLQGFLEIRGIAYSGSGLLASALAAHRVKAQDLLRACGIRSPTSRVLVLSRDPAAGHFAAPLDPPVVLYSPCEAHGSHRWHCPDTSALWQAARLARRCGPRAWIERAVEGRVLSAFVLQGSALGVAEHAEASAPLLIPPEMPAAQFARVLSVAEEAYAALGASGLAQVELCLDDGGAPWVLAVNVLPELAEEAPAARVARVAGMSFEELVRRLLSCVHGGSTSRYVVESRVDHARVNKTA